MSRLWVAAVVLVACSATSDRSSGAPAIVARISSDLVSPSQMDRLEIRVDSGGATTFQRLYDLPSDAHLPGTLTVAATSGKGTPPPGTLAPGTVPAGDVGATVTITVRASLAGVPLVSRSARFVMPSSQHALEVPITGACAAIMCPDGQTCDQGTCVSEDVDATSLPGFGT